MEPSIKEQSLYFDFLKTITAKHYNYFDSPGEFIESMNLKFNEFKKEMDQNLLVLDGKKTTFYLKKLKSDFSSFDPIYYSPNDLNNLFKPDNYSYNYDRFNNFYSSLKYYRIVLENDNFLKLSLEINSQQEFATTTKEQEMNAVAARILFMYDNWTSPSILKLVAGDNISIFDKLACIKHIISNHWQGKYILKTLEHIDYLLNVKNPKRTLTGTPNSFTLKETQYEIIVADLYEVLKKIHKIDKATTPKQFNYLFSGEVIKRPVEWISTFSEVAYFVNQLHDKFKIINPIPKSLWAVTVKCFTKDKSRILIPQLSKCHPPSNTDELDRMLSKILERQSLSSEETT